MHERYEFIDKQITSNPVERIKELNYMGNHGWELCCIIKVRLQWIAFFKREKRA